jgi:hypothetical protein
MAISARDLAAAEPTRPPDEPLRRLIAEINDRSPPPPLSRRQTLRLARLPRRYAEAAQRSFAAWDYFEGEPDRDHLPESIPGERYLVGPLAAADAAEAYALDDLEHTVRAAVADPDGRCAVIVDSRLYAFGKSTP